MYLRQLDGSKKKIIEVSGFQWKPALKGEDLQGLRCTCCEHRLGDRKWGYSWIYPDGDTHGRGSRLCFACAQKAEKLAGRKVCPSCNGVGLDGWEICTLCKGKRLVTPKVHEKYINKKIKNELPL